jgi:threonine dehydrogenase-like Zn-dependent dehydrogenase
MDASFGTTPLAMSRAVRLMEKRLVDAERIISHRVPLERIDDAVDIMSKPDRNKVIVQP